MQLTIDEITDADDGDYYCHAENSFGLATQPVSVRIRNTVLLIIMQELARAVYRYYISRCKTI